MNSTPTDTSSSVSRQHYIDTGHYGNSVVGGWLECSTCDGAGTTVLTNGEALED